MDLGCVVYIASLLSSSIYTNEGNKNIDCIFNGIQTIIENHKEKSAKSSEKVSGFLKLENLINR
jgi:hypothetical protein